jgi:hypothetical protein
LPFNQQKSIQFADARKNVFMFEKIAALVLSLLNFLGVSSVKILGLSSV